jgi:uncharacterized protein involved in exopolysaccharide biosynthesis
MSTSEFTKILDVYQKALLEYKVTGNVAYKTSAENARKFLDSHIQSIRDATSQNATFIDDFVKRYKNTNPELVKMQAELKQVRKKGPELQDIYEGERKEQKEEPVDEYLYYTKAAIIGGLFALVAVLSFV